MMSLIISLIIALAAYLIIWAYNSIKLKIMEKNAAYLRALSVLGSLCKDSIDSLTKLVPPGGDESVYCAFAVPIVTCSEEALQDANKPFIRWLFRDHIKHFYSTYTDYINYMKAILKVKHTHDLFSDDVCYLLFKASPREIMEDE